MPFLGVHREEGVDTKRLKFMVEVMPRVLHLHEAWFFRCEPFLRQQHKRVHGRPGLREGVGADNGLQLRSKSRTEERAPAAAQPSAGGLARAGAALNDTAEPLQDVWQARSRGAADMLCFFDVVNKAKPKTSLLTPEQLALAFGAFGLEYFPARVASSAA